MFFDKQTVDSLVDALQKFKPNKYNQQDLITQASQFSKEIFKAKFTKYLEEKCTF